MISSEAAFERKWRPFPILGALIGNQMPSTCAKTPSDYDNVLDWVRRSAEIALTVTDNQDIILSATEPEVSRTLPADLEHLEDQLRHAIQFLSQHAETIGNMRFTYLNKAKQRRNTNEDR
jgi:hypothetical protein